MFVCVFLCVVVAVDVVVVVVVASVIVAVVLAAVVDVVVFAVVVAVVVVVYVALCVSLFSFMCVFVPAPYARAVCVCVRMCGGKGGWFGKRICKSRACMTEPIGGGLQDC